MNVLSVFWLSVDYPCLVGMSSYYKIMRTLRPINNIFENITL